jgi:hypothetical protein
LQEAIANLQWYKPHRREAVVILQWLPADENVMFAKISKYSLL